MSKLIRVTVAPDDRDVVVNLELAEYIGKSKEEDDYAAVVGFSNGTVRVASPSYEEILNELNITDLRGTKESE